jgi:hypothetical protein
MRQYRLRTIMALIVIIAVSIWVGMMIERARRPVQGNTFTITVSRPANGATRGYAIVPASIATDRKAGR